MTSKLIELTWCNIPDRFAYFDPLLDTARNTPITVATLNYDNGIELRAGALGVLCNTGIRTWSDTGILPRKFTGTGIDLIKLHGSVKWWWSKPPLSLDGLHYRELHEVDDDYIREATKNHGRTDDLGRRLGVIFGGRNKLTAEGPFLDLLVKFKENLDSHSHLLVIGYSFRDEHVNRCVVRWLGTDASRCITIVDREGASTADNLFCRIRAYDLGKRLTFEPIGVERAIATHFGNRC